MRHTRFDWSLAITVQDKSGLIDQCALPPGTPQPLGHGWKVRVPEAVQGEEIQQKESEWYNKRRGLSGHVFTRDAFEESWASYKNRYNVQSAATKSAGANGEEEVVGEQTQDVNTGASTSLRRSGSQLHFPEEAEDEDEDELNIQNSAELPLKVAPQAEQIEIVEHEQAVQGRPRGRRWDEVKRGVTEDVEREQLNHGDRDGVEGEEADQTKHEPVNQVMDQDASPQYICT